MAVINGYLAYTGQKELYADSISSDLTGFAGQLWPPYASYEGPYLSGSLITHFPIQANGQVISASLQPSYMDDFYYRIHINPTSVDVGNVIGTQAFTVNLWNAFLTPETFTTVQQEGTDGIVMSGQNAPYTMKPLQQLTYTVTVGTDGPADIDANYTWVFEYPVTLSITGQRATMFLFEPNYNNDLSQSFAWLTDVIRSYNGKEQRRTVRQKATQGLSYSAYLDPLNGQRLRNYLKGWQNRVFAVPFWPDQQTLVTPVGIGATTIPVNPASRMYSVGGLAVLTTGFNDYEVIEVNALSSTIQAKKALQKAWPAGTLVYPLNQYHLTQSTPIKVETDLHSTAVFDFTSSPDTDGLAIAPGAAVEIYKGFEVCPYLNDWKGGYDLSAQFAFETISNTSGKTTWTPTEPFGDDVTPLRLLLQTRAEIYTFTQFLMRRRGRAICFWRDNEINEFTITTPIGATDTFIRVVDNGYLRFFKADSPRRYIKITTRTGYFYREITNAVAGAAGEINLTIDAALGTLTPVANIMKVSMLELSRLDVDKITINWKTHSKAICNIPTRTVRQ